mgnify:CR=1 FL=1
MADLYRPYSQGLLSEEPTRLEDMYAPAATGLLFAPGAGVADLMGQAPDPSRPGEMLPSFYENVTGGNYLDAGLQALGGAGDAVQMMGAAFPPAIAVGAAMKAPRGIRAFHGSPYHFNKFRLDKIGTGEGAQAYGHGLYFAENEGIAKHYRDTLSNRDAMYLNLDGQKIDSIYTQDNIDKFGDFIQKNFDEDEYDDVLLILDNLGQGLGSMDGTATLQAADEYADDAFNLRQGSIYERLREFLTEPEPVKGAMYEVNIAADPSNMIDYDAPLSQQSSVLNAIENTYGDPEIILTQLGLDLETATGRELIEALSGVGQMNRENASSFLSKAGIPGIKYFSDTSRNTSGGELIDVIKDADGFKAKVAVDNRAGGLGGKGRVVTTSKPYKTEQEARDWAEQATKNQERNFVVFDDSMIEIMRKYGLLAPLVGAGTVAAVSDMGEDRGLLEM